jgi:hypothetical protein
MVANTYVPRAKRFPERPHQWISGPTEELHNKYYAWLKHKAQAQYRKEAYELTWEDWQMFWQDDLWYLRGRACDDLCITRKDILSAWSQANCEIVSRQVQLSRQAKGKRGRPRGPYNKR